MPLRIRCSKISKLIKKANRATLILKVLENQILKKTLTMSLVIRGDKIKRKGHKKRTEKSKVFLEPLRIVCIWQIVNSKKMSTIINNFHLFLLVI